MPSMDGSRPKPKSKPNGMRQRGGKGHRSSPKKKAPSDGAAKNAKANPNANAKANANGPGPSPPTTTKNGPGELAIFLLVTALVLLPYGLRNAYLFVFLQRPEWLSLSPASSWVSPALLRPSVGEADPRRVLVVGTMSSGTTQLAHDLAGKPPLGLGLEIGHENSETLWSFVRDGTVSWFHGIRFLPRPGIDLPGSLSIELPAGKRATGGPFSMAVEGELLFRYAVGSLCRDLHPNIGFHPFMFRDGGRCSLRQSWNACWRDECESLLEREWGCGLRDSSSSPLSSSQSSSFSSGCTTPYRKHLLQVRHPLRVVESLVTKFCIGGVAGEVQPSFLLFARALFPHSEAFSSGETKPSCIEAAGHYVYEYNTAMLGAKKDGHIDDVFSVEGATPCAVAKLAGFLDETENEQRHEATIRENLLEACHGDAGDANQERDSNTKTKVNRPMVSTQNTYNQGRLSLDWDDLLGGKHGSQKKEGDRHLRDRLKKMARKDFGYD